MTSHKTEASIVSLKSFTTLELKFRNAFSLKSWSPLSSHGKPGRKGKSLLLRPSFAVQFSRSVMSDSLQPHELQHAGPPVHHQLPEFTQTHVHRVSDAIQPSHPLLAPSAPASNPSQHQSFPMSQLFAWGGQSTGVSASASVLPVNTQNWSPLEWTEWISLQSKGLSRVFSNTTVQKHQFFGAQLSL